MKKIIISIILAVVATFSAKAQTTIIDFDYAKETDISLAWFDFNQDMDLDDGEAFVTGGHFSFDYKDFKDSGNVFDATLHLTAQNGNYLDFEIYLRDISLVYYMDSTGAPTFMVVNQLTEPQISISISDDTSSVLVFNPAILKEK